MLFELISRLVILLVGILQPTYASFKAIRQKNSQCYAVCMMHWIVFGLFTCVESITDLFFSWLPFYYTCKILLVLWLGLAHGSGIFYRKFLHPFLLAREDQIDDFIYQASENGYKTFLMAGTHLVNNTMAYVLQNVAYYTNDLQINKGDDVICTKYRSRRPKQILPCDLAGDLMEERDSEPFTTRSSFYGSSGGTSDDDEPPTPPPRRKHCTLRKLKHCGPSAFCEQNSYPETE